jgi:hypothetical protein
MIGNLARRSEQIENEAVQWTDLRTRRTPARLAFADHMDRFIAGDRTVRQAPQNERWLARTRRLMAR